MNGSEVEEKLVKNETVDPFDVLQNETNPWSVEDASVFLKYCCPECEFSDWNLKSFADHALENHTGSNVLFTTDDRSWYSNDISENPDENIFIKEENSDNEDNGYIETENSFSKEVESQRKPEKKKVKTKKKKKLDVKLDMKEEKENVKEWNCAVCFLECSSKTSLGLHYKETHKSGRFQVCTLCDYKAVQSNHSWRGLCVHIDKKHPDFAEKKHFCEQCGKGFIYIHTLNYHKKSHEEKVKHACDLCGEEYVSMQSFKDHMFVKHGVPQEYKNLVCELCGYSALTRQHLSRHVHRKHTSMSATPLFCEKCGFSTMSKEKLYKHNVVHHNIENHKKCSYCDFKTSQTNKLHIHIDNNHPEYEEKHFLCEKCNKTFTYQATFTDHSKYKCKYSEYYQTKGREHYDKRRIIFKCDYCDDTFKTLKSGVIKNHYKDIHPGKPIIAEGQTRYSCTMCRKFFFFEDELNCHMNLEHGVKTEKNYCPKCKAAYVDQHTCRFEKKYQYNREKREFACKQCDKTYSSNAHLEGHIKTVHENRLDFECQHCSKKVGSKIKLKNHIFSCHSQVKCEICGKDIANPYDLRKHKVFVHKETKGVWLCERCPKSMFLSKSTYEKHLKEKHL